MNNILYSTIFILALLITGHVAVQSASATLGETVDSVATDRKAMSAVKGATTTSSDYTIQEIVSDSTTIREYISPGGIVFAVAWNGLTNPDLTTLLGSYTNEYQDALQKTPHEKGRRVYRIKASRLVVEKWGHMRNLQGRAYVPSLIPSGVSINAIK